MIFVLSFKTHYPADCPQQRAQPILKACSGTVLSAFDFSAIPCFFPMFLPAALLPEPWGRLTGVLPTLCWPKAAQLLHLLLWAFTSSPTRLLSSSSKPVTTYCLQQSSPHNWTPFSACPAQGNILKHADVYLGEEGVQNPHLHNYYFLKHFWWICFPNYQIRILFNTLKTRLNWKICIFSTAKLLHNFSFNLWLLASPEDHILNLISKLLGLGCLII